MKICLINLVKKTSIIEYIFRPIPYNLHILKAVTPQKHKVTIVSISSFKKIPTNYDLYGFSVNCSNVDIVCKCSGFLRQRNKKVILGGPQTVTDQERLSKVSDSVVIGEAEEIWPNIIRDLEQNKLKKRYVCKPIDLHNFPMIYRPYSRLTTFYNILLTSKGCPYKCAFCDQYRFGSRKVRIRPINDVLREIKDIETRSRGIYKNLMGFTDINIFGDREYAKALFESINGTKLRWFSQTSIDITNDEALLELAYNAGCRGLEIGFESLNKDNLREIKPQNVKYDYLKQSKILKKHKILLCGTFIVGLRHDTSSVFMELMEFADQSGIDFMIVNSLEAREGTKITGKKRNKDNICYVPRGLTYLQFLNSLLEFHKKFYSIKRTMLRAYNMVKVRKNKYSFRTLIVLPLMYFTISMAIRRMILVENIRNIQIYKSNNTKEVQ